jgi:hypothetical protein
MKRAFLSLSLLALLAVPAGAVTGGIGVHAGWVDMDDAGDDAGWGLLANFGVSPHVDIQLRMTDFRSLVVDFTDDDFPPGQVLPNRGFEYQSTLVDFGFSYNFRKDGRAFTPFVGGGGTYYLLDSTPDSNGRVNDEYGWYGLAGLDFMFAERWGAYVEGMWRDAKMTIRGDGFGIGGPVDVGVDLNGPQVNLGIKFAW